MKPKTYKNYKCFCYYAPDGEPQVRTIDPNKEISQKMLQVDGETNTYLDYERQGFVQHKVTISIIPKKPYLKES